MLFAGCETGTQPAAQASLPTEQEMREYYAELITWPVKVEEEREDTLPEVTLTTEFSEYPADVEEIPLTLTNAGKDVYEYGPYPVWRCRQPTAGTLFIGRAIQIPLKYLSL